jgi:hypothetical protein
MDTDTDDHEPGTDPSEETTGRTFSQAEVDKLLAKTRRQGESSGLKAAAEALGMSVDEARAFIEAKRQAEEAELTEAQRAKAAADQARAEADRIVAEARASQLRADATVALLGAEQPLNRDRLDLALRVVLPDILASDDDDRIDTAIGALRAQSPEWFGAITQSNGDTRPGTPPPPAPGRKVNESKAPANGAKDRARQLWGQHQARLRPPMPTRSDT